MENIPSSKLQMPTLNAVSRRCASGHHAHCSKPVACHAQDGEHVGCGRGDDSDTGIRGFEVIVVDRREIDNLQEFLSAVRHSKLNRECALVGIVRDRLDRKQAFAVGVHS